VAADNKSVEVFFFVVVARVLVVIFAGELVL
jgi:hypothetical protein